MDRAQLEQLLDGTLSPTSEHRAQCEAQLTTLLHTPGFAAHLCELLVSTTPEPSPMHRHLICLLIKRLGKRHWELNTGHEDGDNEYDAPTQNESVGTANYIVSEDEKQRVKALLLNCIQTRLEAFAESKLQTALCLAVMSIFERDGPDHWKEVLPVMLELIRSEQTQLLYVTFSVRFLSMAADYFSGENCCDLVAEVFPHLQRLFSANDMLPVGVRTRIVRIVKASLLMVGMEAVVGNDRAKALLQTHIDQWIQLFLTQLTHGSVQQPKDYGLKIQILNALTSFVQEWPEEMEALLPRIVPLLFEMLVNGVTVFESNVVNNDEGEDDGYDSDSEGALVGHSALIVSVLEFMRGMALYAPTKQTRQLVLGGLADVVYVVIAYMQIPTCQAQLWQEDPNKYIADEDDDSTSYDIRNAATELMSELDAALGRKAVGAILSACQRRLKEDTGANWRLQEATLLIVGSLSRPLLSAVRKGDADILNLMDVSGFLQTLFALMNDTNQSIFLRARALWCTSQFVPGMNDEMLNHFLQIAISGIDQSQLLPVRMYACRAMASVVKSESGKGALQQSSDTVIERLLHLADQSSGETLHIALETLLVVAQETELSSLPIVKHALNCFLQHWGHNLSDPLMAELVDGLLSRLLEQDNLQIISVVHEQTLPILQTVLNSSKHDLDSSGTGIHNAAAALAVLKTIVRHAFVVVSSGGLPGMDQHTVHQMAVQILQHVFDPVIEILYVVDDDATLNTGAECLKWLVMFASEPLLQYSSDRTGGGNGIDAILNVAAKQLSPDVPASSAVSVGGLITQVLQKCGHTLPTQTVQSILSAVSNRLATSRLTAVSQSLCMVFARLVHSHGQDLLHLLEQLPSPSVHMVAADDISSESMSVQPSNLLQFVFASWIEKQSEFYGSYGLKVTISALVKVAEWNDARVNDIRVTGSAVNELTSTESTGPVLTRAQTKQLPQGEKKEYLTVHFLSKLVVVLAKMLSQVGEEEEEEWEPSEGEEEEYSDDEEDSDSAQETTNISSAFAPAEQYSLLSDQLDGPSGEAMNGDDDDIEFEAQFDPLNDISLMVEIPRTLQSISTNSTLLNSIMPELTAEDKDILSIAAASAQ